MNKYVFDYLRIIGFTDDEINYIEDNNDNIFYASLSHVKKLIDILQNLGLDNINIKNLLIKNVYMITEKIEKINILNNIYLEDLKFSKEELKKLIIVNPESYMISISELNKNIDYLKKHNYNIDAIKYFFIVNPKLINLSSEEFNSVVKFN